LAQQTRSAAARTASSQAAFSAKARREVPQPGCLGFPDPVFHPGVLAVPQFQAGELAEDDTLLSSQRNGSRGRAGAATCRKAGTVGDTDEKELTINAITA
jgi:hypothetical protein